MTDGTVLVLAGSGALTAAAVLEHIWKRHTRYRGWALVTEQDGTRHLSRVSSETDAADMLDMEQLLHEGTGWTVDRYPGMLRLEKRGVVRWIWIRCPR